MGYPMTYSRVIHRSGLLGGYDDVKDRQWDESVAACKASVAGDLRRLEADQRDDAHLATYAAAAGVTPQQVRIILDMLFDGAPERGPWLNMPKEQP